MYVHEACRTYQTMSRICTVLSAMSPGVPECSLPPSRPLVLSLAAIDVVLFRLAFCCVAQGLAGCSLPMPGKMFGADKHGRAGPRRIAEVKEGGGATATRRVVSVSAHR